MISEAFFHAMRYRKQLKHAEYIIRTSADGISKLNMPLALPQMASQN